MADRTAPRPRPWRLALGFLVAPVAGAAGVIGAAMVPSIAWGVLGGGMSPGDVAINLAGGVALMVYAVPVAYALALVVAAPLYALLVGRIGFGVRGPILAGCIVTLPALAVVAVLGVRAAWQDGTGGGFGDGMAMYAGIMLMVLAGGAVGGLAFWFAAVWRDRRLTGPAACPARPLG